MPVYPGPPVFVGNAHVGRKSAILASLTSTWRRHDVNPQLYLTVVDELVGVTNERALGLAAGSMEATSGRKNG
jgi:hypothetical protein